MEVYGYSLRDLEMQFQMQTFKSKKLIIDWKQLLGFLELFSCHTSWPYPEIFWGYKLFKLKTVFCKY